MKLNKDEDKLHDHMMEAESRVAMCKDADNKVIRNFQKQCHSQADEAFARGDVVEHRIWNMAANLLTPHWRDMVERN